MLVLLKLYPSGDMLINPDVIQWARPFRVNKVDLRTRGHEDKERTEFFIKDWDFDIYGRHPLADCSLKEFHQLMGSE